MIDDRNFTRVKYDRLIQIEKNKKNEIFVCDYTTMLRYIVIQKFGVQMLKERAKTVARLMIIYHVVSIYESDKQKTEEDKSKLDSLRGKFSNASAYTPIFHKPH